MSPQLVTASCAEQDASAPDHDTLSHGLQLFTTRISLCRRPPIPRASSKRSLKQTVSSLALFTQEAASDFRSRWDLVQRSFVDDPRAAVRAADELVAQVTQSLAGNLRQPTFGDLKRV